MHRERITRPQKKRCAIYARVSEHRQKTDGDLDRQLEALTSECRNRFKTSPLVLTDIGSGLNMQRRGLKALLRLAKQDLIHSLFITYRNRLARFGVDLIQQVLADFGVEVILLHEVQSRTPQEELIADMMALIASFSGRVYGLQAGELRRHRQHQVVRPSFS